MKVRPLAAGLAGAAVSALLATGCSGDAKKGSSSATTSAAPNAEAPDSKQKLPKGYHQIGGPVNGLMVAVPADWKAVDVTEKDGRQIAEGAGIKGPIVKQALEVQRRHHAVYAFDTKTARTGVASNLNGFCTPSSAGSSTAKMRAATEAGLKQVGAKELEITETTIGGRPVVRAGYSLALAGQTMSGVQYHVAGTGSKSCFVTMTARQDAPTAKFDEIAATIRPL